MKCGRFSQFWREALIGEGRMWRPSEGAPKPDYLLKMIFNMAANSSRVSGYSHPLSSAAHLHCVCFVQPPISQTGAIKHMIQFCWSTKGELNTVRVYRIRPTNFTKKILQRTLRCFAYNNLLYRVIKLTATLAKLSVTKVIRF